MKFEEIDRYAREMMAKHLSTEWKLAWGNAKTVWGSCNHQTKVIRLSRFVMERVSKAEVKDTVLHEIAHALTLANEPAHGPQWRANARKLGCSTRATAPATEHELNKEVKTQYKYAIVLPKEDGTQEFVYGYLRKPNPRTIATISDRYIKGRKEETLGKLAIVQYK